MTIERIPIPFTQSGHAVLFPEALKIQPHFFSVPILSLPAAADHAVCAADRVHMVHAQSMWMIFSIRSAALTFGL